MDYSQLSDFEINRMVGDIIFKGLWACKPETSGNNTNKWYYGNADTTFEPLNPLPDYCNDPSASWPIIEKYRISIINLDEDEWGARGVFDFEVESSTGVAQYADRLFLSATTDGINYGREQMIEQNEPFVYDKRVLWKRVGRIRKNIGFKLRVITKSPVTMSGCQIRIE